MGAVPKPYNAEPLEQKLRRIQATGVGVEKTQEVIYSDTYQEGYDIRTDRFEVALNALCKVDTASAQAIAKAQKEATAAARKTAGVEGEEPTTQPTE